MDLPFLLPAATPAGSLTVKDRLRKMQLKDVIGWILKSPTIGSSQLEALRAYLTNPKNSGKRPFFLSFFLSFFLRKLRPFPFSVSAYYLKSQQIPIKFEFDSAAVFFVHLTAALSSTTLVPTVANDFSHYWAHLLLKPKALSGKSQALSGYLVRPTLLMSSISTPPELL